QEFDGVITSITKFGMFIELPNTVEGLIHVNQLKSDYFHFIESHLALVGERTGVVYKIGQQVRIKVTKADVDTREIDFELLSAEPLTDKIEIPKQQKGQSNQKRHLNKKGNETNKTYSKDKKNGPKGKSNGKSPFYKKAIKSKKGRKKKS
ncbi:MAG: S1 RNA-binding domain-containing protein, partial [Vagococcus sp.]